MPKQKGTPKGALNDKQRLFCQEYLVDNNATQAAIRAGYSPNTAGQYSFQLLNKTSVQEEIKRLREERAERVQISADDVLQRWWALATSDARELINVHHDACRYCWSKKHRYHWINKLEWEQACIDAKGKDLPAPDNAGGYGYHPDKGPHPHCPQCFGRGLLDIRMADTRRIHGSAALLYAGIKQTQSGIEVKLEDRANALTQVAKHLGMFKESVDLPAGGTLATLLDAVMGNTLKPQEE